MNRHWLIFRTIVCRDLSLALRQSSGVWPLLAFFAITVSLFPLSVGPDPRLLQEISVGVLFVCALLASMLAVPKLFEEDYEDGSLTQLMLQQTLPEIVVSAKILAHWLATGVPLIVVAPMLALLLNMPPEQMFRVVLALLVGTPTLSLIGAVGAALTLGIRRAGGLIGLLVLPLYIPVLIFGVGAGMNADSSTNSMALLAGVLLFILPLGVWAATAAVKVVMEE
jgi:heme exporter protein B